MSCVSVTPAMFVSSFFHMFLTYMFRSPTICCTTGGHCADDTWWTR